MKCRLCNSTSKIYSKAVYALDGQSYDLLKCPGCGVVFVAPFPDAHRIAALYDDAYFQRDYSFGIVEGDYLASEVAREGEYRRVLRSIARLTHGRKLLEVGCAAGAFLKDAVFQGWNAVGVDISPWAVKTARERFNLDVREGNLEDQKFPSSSFDAVFFGDLIEHLPDPMSFLREVERVVKPHDEGGVVVAKVPTYVNSFYYRWLKTISKISRLDKSQSALTRLMKLSGAAPKMPPYHVFEHNLESVRWIFNRAGLEIFREDKTLMIPEFLYTRRDAWAKAALGVFQTLRFFIESFGLPGGHVFVYAASSKKGKLK